MRGLVVIVAAGAALRFATLDAQSFWLDEAATVDLLRRGFGDMLEGVADGESTPPLFYVIAWLWAKVAGTGEVGVRSLSALAGTATIPVAYALGARLGGRTAALVAGVACAANPFLVWYSQEARAYAMLVLLCALSLLLFLRLLEGERTARTWTLWAACSGAALLTHYFALFPVAAEAAWLLAAARVRAAAVAAGAVATAGLAILPLALRQRSNDTANFIADLSLPHRVGQVPKQFAVGYDAPAELLLGLAVAAAAGVSVAGLVRGSRGALVPVAAVAAAAAGIPLAMAIFGADYLIARNVLPALVPLLVVGAAGAAAAGRAPAGAAAALLAGVGVAAALGVAADPSYQRDDWRAVAEALGPPSADRVVFVGPPAGVRPLALYLEGSRPVGPEGRDARDVGMVSLSARVSGERVGPKTPPQAVPPIPFMDLVRRTDTSEFTVMVFVGRRRERFPSTVGASTLDLRPARLLFQPAR